MPVPTITFEKHEYVFEKTIPTTFVSTYIPDWDIKRGLRESIQNALDEGVIANCNVTWRETSSKLVLKDAGRGVTFADILHTGKSGKRDRTDTVGQHGEGEVVAWIPLLRDNVNKLIASQDWLAIAEFVEEEGDQLLVIHRYRTDVARVGTIWQFYTDLSSAVSNTSLIHEPFKSALQDFANHLYFVRHKRQATEAGLEQTRWQGVKRIAVNGNGKLYSRGVVVNSERRLRCSYNLTATPGRDRGGFVYANIENELKSIFKDIDSKVLAELLIDTCNYGGASWWATYYNEFSWNVDLPETIVKRALKIVRAEHPKICWIRNTEGSKLADAEGQGIKPIVFGLNVPDWVKIHIPHVDRYIKAQGSSKHLTEPKRGANALHARLRNSVQTLLDLANWSSVQIAATVFDDGTVAAADREGKKVILLSAKQCEKMSWREFLGTIAHELSHIATDAEDCTRAHAQGIADILSLWCDMGLDNGSEAVVLRAARRKFETWKKHRDN